MKKEVERDRSKVAISKISSLGLMEITREMVCNNFSFTLKVNDFCTGFLVDTESFHLYKYFAVTLQSTPRSFSNHMQVMLNH